jgi:carbonic anhydrase/acetyltransferase-like protein (isoleucine patch superfamily)
LAGLAEARIHPDAFIASGVQVWGDVVIGAEAVLMFGVVVRAEYDSISIGDQSNLQDQVVVHCDEGIPCRVGRRVTVGHAAVVHGAEIGDAALIGIGAIVLNRSIIGQGSWIGAGAVVTEGTIIPPMTLALGAPARVIRDLKPSELANADDGVERYLELAKAYRRLSGSHRA